jgi:hypothetical protein
MISSYDEMGGGGKGLTFVSADAGIREPVLV